MPNNGPSRLFFPYFWPYIWRNKISPIKMSRKLGSTVTKLFIKNFVREKLNGGKSAER